MKLLQNAWDGMRRHERHTGEEEFAEIDAPVTVPHGVAAS